MLEFKNLLNISFVKRKPSGKQSEDPEDIRKKKKQSNLEQDIKNKIKNKGNQGGGKNQGGQGNQGGGKNQGGQGSQGGGKKPIKQDCVYYYRSQLSEAEQKAYDLLLAGLYEVKASIKVGKLMGKSISRVWYAIYYDHPEIFWYKGHYQYRNGDTYIEYLPRYLYDKEERDKRQVKVDRVVNQFLDGMSETMTEYERLKAVYEFIILHVEYVLNSPDNQNIYSALVNQKSVCAGYSRAAQYLLQIMGFECLYARGPCEGEGYHAWNIVKCNGKYYQMDATWGDANYGKGKGSRPIPKELSIEYAYLCCTDEQIYKSRKTDVDFALPICNSTDLNYYKLNGLQFMVYCDNVRKTMEENLKAGKTYWKAQFSNKKAWKAALDEVHKGLFTKCASKYGNKKQTWISSNEKMLTIVTWIEQN